MIYMFHDTERDYMNFWGNYDCINEDYAIQLGQDIANHSGFSIRVTNGHNGKVITVVHPKAKSEVTA